MALKQEGGICESPQAASMAGQHDAGNGDGEVSEGAGARLWRAL